MNIISMEWYGALALEKWDSEHLEKFSVEK